MVVTRQDTRRIEARLKACQEVLTALGDETRQHIICAMLEVERPGTRAVDIAQRANLSRPTVSHHLQVLKRAGIVCARKEGPRIYYYLDPDQRAIHRLHELAGDILDVTSSVKATAASRGKDDHERA